MTAMNPNLAVSIPQNPATGDIYTNNTGLAAFDPSTAQATAGNAAGATEGMSGMESIGWGNFCLSAGSAIAGIISSCIGYQTAKIQMQAQRDSTISALDHQDRLAEIQMEAQQEVLSLQEEAIADKVEGQKQYNAAVEERARAENQLAVVKAKVEEKEKTEKAGKLDTGALDRLFRSKYSLGDPA